MVHREEMTPQERVQAAYRGLFDAASPCCPPSGWEEDMADAIEDYRAAAVAAYTAAMAELRTGP